jgi:hypothetical protein
MKRSLSAALLILFFCGAVVAESFRTIIAGRMDVSADNPNGSVLPLSYIDSALVTLGGDHRFLRGVELELRVPQAYLKYRGSLAIAFYVRLGGEAAVGVADLSADRVGFELMPNKLQTVYRIPLREGHGFKVSPYVSIPTKIIPPDSFPLLFRVMPVIKGLPEELEMLRFQLSAKPIITDEGALKITLKYPEKLKDKPLTIRLDDAVLDLPPRELLLKEGEHHIAIVSDDYRNESRRVMIEKGKVLDLVVELQDPTPLVSIDAPANAVVYFDDTVVTDPRAGFLAEPGEHKIRFSVGDYSVVKPVTLRKGRVYRIALSIDVTVTEEE